jgi:hypothetical protein
MARPSTCAVYAVFFGPKGTKCFLDRPDNVHLQLLERHHLREAFEQSPQDFIMGRWRMYSSGEFLVDVCSDLWRGKCGDVSPLANISADRRNAFEVCLLETFTDTVYLVDEGFSCRAPSINEKRLHLMVAQSGKQFCILRHAAAR